MTEAPERIWIEDEFGEGDDDQWTYGTWDVRNYAGYNVEYVRADTVQAQIDAAVKAERARCAKVALREGEAMERAARSFLPPKTHADDAVYHMHVGGAQTATRIAAAIRKGANHE